MSDLQNGMLVQHASLGVGKIVALDEKTVHVFFATSGARFATKLRLPMALPLLAPAAGANAWLSGLSSFTLDEKTGRYGLGGSAWLSHEDAVARFRDAYPGGFQDPKYLGEGAEKRERISRWRLAHDAYVETLGNGEGERLLAAGDLGALTERALRVERHVRTLQREAERTSLEDALKNLEASRGYFAALFELLAAPAPDQVRFEALAAAVAVMSPGAPGDAGWPLVTLLPFVARPDLHVLLRPRFAHEVAQRLGLDLAYSAEPNWSTYSALLGTAEALLQKLRPIGARDHMDVETFLHVVMTKRPRPKPRARLAT